MGALASFFSVPSDENEDLNVKPDAIKTSIETRKTATTAQPSSGLEGNSL